MATTRGCLYGRARPRGLYLNTGYAASLRVYITPSCRRAGGLGRVYAAAYAIGCSEAASSLRQVVRLGLTRPSVWWLDVETSNSWSRDRALNTAVLRGIIAFLARVDPTVAVGIYSRRSWWREITAGWSTGSPEWIPSVAASCPRPFSNGPVWMRQAGSPGVDLDTAC